MRVIDEEGAQKGVLSLTDALALAQQKGLDLVEVQPLAAPPVAKLMNWAKFLYREQKSDRKKHHTKAGKVKEIRFALSTFIHDLQVKALRAENFLAKGYKVRVSVKLRRFEQNRKEETKTKIKEFLEFIRAPIAFDQKPQKAPFGYVFIIRKYAKDIKDNSKEV